MDIPAAQRALSRIDVANLGTLVEAFPREQKLAIGMKLLQDVRVASDPIVRGPLEAIRQGLEGVTSLNPTASTLLDETRHAIGIELLRTSGITPAGLVEGLKGHPEYAVIGDIKSNLEILKQFGAI